MGRTLVFILIGLAATLTRAEDRDLSTCPIRFAIIGDRTGGHMDHVYDSVVVEIERLRPDFVITVGDMIEGYASDAADYAEEWREYREIVAPLSMPIHYTPGNHDITTDVGLQPYREYVGEPVHSFDFRGLHIAVLDNSRIEVTDGWPQEQLDWLTADLAAHEDAAYTMVFYHKPFWYNTVFLAKPDPLHDICRKFGVDAVVSGHMHCYFSDTFDGIQYTTVGSSGADTGPDTTYMGYHFAWVTVDGAGIHISPLRAGSVETWDHTSTAEFFFMNQASALGLSMAEPVALGGNLALQDSVVTLAVHNLSQSLPLHDSIRWTTPEGWFVEPSAIGIDLQPGATASFDFGVRRSGPLYPLPEALVLMPYNADRSYRASRALRVARQASAFRVETSPRLDGLLDDFCWREPEVFLFDWEGNPAQHEPVEFYFAYDNSSLYLAVSCRDSEPDSIIATQTGPDAAVYTEDCIGYFLQPDLTSPVVYQIYVGPTGAVFDQKIEEQPDGYFSGDPRWNGDYDIVTGRSDQGWTVEMRIAIEQFGLAQIGLRDWGLSFRRKQPRLGTGDWQIREGYNSSAFGRLVLQK